MADVGDDERGLNPVALGIRDRVQQALRKTGLTQSEAARQAERISPKAIRQLLSNATNRGAKPRDPEVQRAFAEVLGVDAGWLWYGSAARVNRGRMWPPPDDDNEELQEAIIQHADGESRGAVRSPQGPSPAHSAASVASPANSILQSRPDPAGYVVPVASGAWEPIVTVGDCLVVSPSYPPTVGGLVYAKGPFGEGLFRLAMLTNDTVTLVRPTGMPVTLPRAGLLVHRVSGVIFD